jgi:hypothetical protein
LTLDPALEKSNFPRHDGVRTQHNSIHIATKEAIMPTQQGDLALLNDPAARRLLQSSAPARIAYTGPDGARCEHPAHFEWDGIGLVFRISPGLPGPRAVPSGAKVTVTIDSHDLLCSVLVIRGSVRIGSLLIHARQHRETGDRAGGAGGTRLATMERTFTGTALMVVEPEHVTLLEFHTRVPSHAESDMERLRTSR